MGQVPGNKSYLVIGDGRLAKHLSFYFESQNIQIKNWNRKSNNALSLQLNKGDTILLAINDDSIASFYEENNLKDYQCIHFSGKLAHKDILGFHPLMTFSENLYDVDFYSSIPFVGDQAQEKFEEIFPGLKNSYYTIKKENKELYHSLCTLSGNGTTLLWELISQHIEKIDLPDEILKPYLLKVCENILLNKKGRFTGPWYRKDQSTIEAHKKSLTDTPLHKLYDSFETLSENIGSTKGAKNEKHSSNARI